MSRGWWIRRRVTRLAPGCKPRDAGDGRAALSLPGVPHDRLALRPSPRLLLGLRFAFGRALLLRHHSLLINIVPASRALHAEARPAPHQQRWRNHRRPVSARSRGVHRGRARPAPRSSVANIAPASSARESAARSGPGPGARREAAGSGRPRLTSRASGPLLGPPAGTRR